MRYIYILSFFLCTVTLYSQDLQLTQFYASPLYLNPAFTGANADSRISTNYRNQWASLPGTYSSFLLSYDYYLHQYRSGVGVILTSDKSGTQGLGNNMLAISYAYDFKFNRIWSLTAGLRMGYAYRTLDFSKLLFGDQIARNASSSLQTTFPEKVNFLDISTGVLVFSSMEWIGISFNHINGPDESFLGKEVPLPIKGSVHGGKNFLLESGGSGPKEDKPIITTAFQYRFQKKYDQFDLGVYFKKPMYFAGIWYRGLPGFKAYKKGYPNHDSFSFLMGVVYKKSLTMGYSFDFTISNLTMTTGGSHEISLSYIFINPNKTKKQRSKIISCPKF
ncbi:MAG: PorP/SprF family type IX secretion system membrane protein [Bacteroidota bacterium]